MRKFLSVLSVVALLVALVAPGPVSAQNPINPSAFRNPINGANTTVAASSVKVLVKYVGTTAGKPTVEVAAGGDLTFKIAGSADTTTGSPNLDGIFDLSTPAAAVDTVGEFVNLVNTTGSNWRAVLVTGLYTDSTDNTFSALSATDAATPSGVPLYSDGAVAQVGTTFADATAVLPPEAQSNIRFWLPPAPGSKINANAFAGQQAFLQMASEQITNAGTIGQFRILAVKNTYDSTGKVSQTVREVHSQTGAATTVRGAIDTGFAATPIAGAPGEFFIIRQEATGAASSVVRVIGVGFSIQVPKE